MRIGKKRPPLWDHRLYCLVVSGVIISGLIVVSCLASVTTAKALGTATQKAATAQKSPKRLPRPSSVEIAGARAKLAELGYWVLREAKGSDASLIHAVIAFQKIEGRKPTGILTRDEIEAISAGQPPTPLETGYTHIEVDLAKQVLLFVEPPGESLRVLPISSGSGEYYEDEGVMRLAETPTGRFKVQRRIDGWRKSRLGLLYYPNYILGGVAIHGNPAVPTFPASHGCIRIPMFAAKEFSELAFIGIPVIVHNGTGTEGPATGNAEPPSWLFSSN